LYLEDTKQDVEPKVIERIKQVVKKLFKTAAKAVILKIVTFI
jgi:hypothetical protein